MKSELHLSKRISNVAAQATFAFRSDTFMVEVLCHGPTDGRCQDVGITFW